MNQTATLTPAQPRVLADLFSHTRVRDAALVLGAALLTAACAQISFPFPGSPVPVTGQTFAVLLTGVEDGFSGDPERLPGGAVYRDREGRNVFFPDLSSWLIPGGRK